jgi:hypothetical protein
MVNPNLHAAFPVILGINGPEDDGHAIVCDGYGYNSSTIYHHLNMGWSGQDDAWYNLPTINAVENKSLFNSIQKCTYNIYTSGTGEIIAGRVTNAAGAPLSGVTITAVKSGGGTYKAATNKNGIYALAKIPSASSYKVSAAKTGYDFGVTQTASTQKSTDGSTTVGNVWGVDFRQTSIPYVDTPAFSNVSLSGATLSANISYNGSYPITGSGVVYGTSANPSVSVGTRVSTSPLATSGTFSVNVMGLNSNTVYHFRGYATNSLGTGYTADATFTTDPGPPVAQPATAIATTLFTAKWIAPPGKAAIKGYYLFVVDKNEAQLPGYYGLWVAGTSRTVKGLSPGTTYSYYVIAVNYGGISGPSKTIQVTTLGSGIPEVGNPGYSSP